MNVVVVVMDSLRADHVYGRGAQHACLGQGLQASRCASRARSRRRCRRSRRAARSCRASGSTRTAAGIPTRTCRRSRAGSRSAATARCGRRCCEAKGWTTGYVTDNPHILLPVHKNFRSRLDRVELVDGQVPLRRKPKRHGRRRRRSTTTCPPSLRGSRHEPRMKAYLQANPRGRPEERVPLAARVHRRRWAGSSGRARASRSRSSIDSFDAHEPWDVPKRHQRHVRLARRERRGADPAVPDAGRQVRAARADAVAAAPHARAVRGRGDDGRRLARATSSTGSPTSACSTTRW